MAGRPIAILPKETLDQPARRLGAHVLSSPVLLIGRIAAPLAIVAGAFIFRRQVTDLIQSLSGLEFVFAIVHLYSTASVRLILGALALGLLAGIGLATFRFVPPRARTTVFAGLCGVLVGIGLWFMGRGPTVSIAVGVLSGCLAAANVISSESWNLLLKHARYGRLLNAAFWVLIGIEFLLPRGYLAWVRGGRAVHVNRSLSRSPRVLLSAAIVAGLFAASAPFSMLMRLGQSMFMSPAATIVFGPEYHEYSRYDVSDLARNPASGDIFLCGQELNSPRVLRGGSGPAFDTRIVNGGSEFCELAAPDALATVNKRSHELLVFDPGSLELRGRLHFDRLPVGEIFLSAFPRLNLLAVASEDEQFLGNGPAIRIVDLDRMKVIREISAEVGYLISDPQRPVIYTNHFAKNAGVRAWDMQTGKLLAISSRFGRSDRMAFDLARNEVLATVPESGQIWRLDAVTLKSKPPIQTVFGARGLGIDPARDLLLVASFLTNELDVVDLKTGQSLRRYRLGPWLRDVLVVSDKGVAYVASRYGVYRVDYLR